MRIGVALLAALAVVPAQAQVFNKNLIVNGDAEAGAAAASPGAAAVSIPNWTTAGGFSVGRYGADGFLATGDYGPVTRGKQLFYGGPGGAPSSAVQTVDLTGAAPEIDAGRAKFLFSGYLGLLGGSYDNIGATSITIDFQDAANTTLLHSVVNAPSVADIECCLPEGLMLRTASGFLPANVRKAKVTINLSIGGGGTIGNNYAADNLSLTLTTDPMFGVNLLVNGDGETDPGADEAPVPGWNSPSKFLAWKYGDYKMPKTADPGPPNRGKYFFNCYVSRTLCQVYQTIDFSAASKLVDAGKVSYALDGWLGGDTAWLDNADVKVAFYDPAGKAIGSGAIIGPVTNADRNAQIGLLERATSGAVPTGARFAQVTINFHKLGPVTDNLYAYADNLSFTLSVMQVTTVVNAASWQTGAVVPGEFVTLGGSGLGPAAYATGWAKGLGGTRVFFNGIEAWSIFTSDGQVNCVVPYGVGTKADVTVQYNGKTSDPFPLAVTDASPGIFTSQYGAGPAAAVNNGTSFNSSANAIARGGVISFWATGQGAVTPAGQDGEAISGFKNLVLPVKVSIGGVDANVQFAGLIYTGEIQVNAVVPPNAPTGDVEVILTLGNIASRKGVLISVK